MSAANGLHELTVAELETVSGGAIVEFAIGWSRFQFNTTPGSEGYTFWNGPTWVGDHESHPIKPK